MGCVKDASVIIRSVILHRLLGALWIAELGVQNANVTALFA